MSDQEVDQAAAGNGILEGKSSKCQGPVEKLQLLKWPKNLR